MEWQTIATIAGVVIGWGAIFIRTGSILQTVNDLKAALDKYPPAVQDKRLEIIETHLYNKRSIGFENGRCEDES